MAKDNKTIGKFRLNGIKRAPAGVPQIEVTFDIDANGILKVSAKDLDTGKEQSITISNNDKMSDAEIEQAIRDAEQYASQDATRRRALEAVNAAQRMINRADAALTKVGKNVEKAEKKLIKNDIADLQKRLAKNHAKLSDEDIQGIVNSTERLKYSSAKVRQLAGDGSDE